MTVIDARATVPMGLTTTKAPFIEQAQQNGQLYITQPYDLYTEVQIAKRDGKVRSVYVEID